MAAPAAMVAVLARNLQVLVRESGGVPASVNFRVAV